MATLDTKETTETIVEDLESLTVYLANHPDALPTDRDLSIVHSFAYSRDEFIEKARLLGEAVEIVHDRSGGVRAEVRFGSAVLYVKADARNLIGERVVPQIDTDALAAEIATARTTEAETAVREGPYERLGDGPHAFVGIEDEMAQGYGAYGGGR